MSVFTPILFSCLELAEPFVSVVNGGDVSLGKYKLLHSFIVVGMEAKSNEKGGRP